MSISVSTSKQQITATVVDDKITATVSGGIGPTGPQGAPGATDYNQLTNVPAAFSPAAHASRHAAAGSDPVTIVAAQVSDFTSAVVAAAPPTTNASLLVSGTLADARLSGNVVLTTDPRLSDSREWSAATVSQADAEAGTSTSRFAFTPRRIFDAIAAWWAGSSAKTKLDTIASGATANATDAQLRDRATHTGTQPASTISDFTTAVVAAAPPTTNASLLTSGTLPDARLSGNIARTSDVSAAQSAAASDATTKANAAQAYAIQRANHTGSQAISTVSGLQAALDSKQAAGTYATLIDGKVPASQLPSYVDDVLEFANLATLPSPGETGKIYTALDTNKIYRWSGSTYIEISPSPGSTDAVAEGSTNLYYTNARASAAAPVQQVAGKTGNVSLTKTDVGLGNVPNVDATARANHTGTQAISTVDGLQTALDGKASLSHAHTVTDISGLATVATSGSAADLTGTLSASRLPSTAVTAGSYGSASSVGTFTVDATGRLTAAGSTSIAISAGAVSGLAAVATSGSYNDLTNKPTIPSAYTLPTASATVLGGVKVGSGLSIDGSSVLSATYSYTLPAATASTLGGVIVGSGLSVSSGTVSANVTSVAGRTGAVTIAAADVSGLGSLATQSSVAYSSLTGTPSTFTPAAHTQAWSTITSTPTTLAGYGITDGLTASSLASPPAIGGTTPAAGSFTTLVASTSLTVPSAVSGTPAAGHVYRTADTLRYRDSSNTERLLLNSADNLANLGNTATARTNLGLGTAATAASSDFAAASHSHAASAITSGTLDIARLPVGQTSTTVAAGNDARFTDARTPTSHASSHASGGSDAISLAASQITSGTISVARLPTVLEQTVTGGNTSTSVTLSLASGSVQTWTLNGNCTFTMPTASAGASLTLILTQSGTFTASFTGVLWSGGTAPTITATNGKVDVLVFVSNGTNWYGTAAQNF